MSETKKKLHLDVSSFTLHILAMFFMLLDHMWATVTPGNDWMTCLGRIAFPIFAFMIAEGAYRTHDLKKYMLRMLIFAVIAEIPFNLMYGSTVFYPMHQNVLWTFLIALGAIYLIEEVKKKGDIKKTFFASVGLTLLAFILGWVTIVDYYGFGVLTVLVFYFFHERKWWCFLGQFVFLWYINVEALGGLMYPVELFGHKFEIVQQGLALLALIPIWLYKGRRGPHNKAFQYFCYAFYPVHCLVLALILKFSI